MTNQTQSQKGTGGMVNPQLPGGDDASHPARELTPDELSADTALLPARKPLDSLYGLVIDGRYRIDRVMGSGGMAQVYAGTYLKTGVKVAIKMIGLSISGDSAMQARSINEARSMMELQSNHVVRAIDVGSLPSGQIYIVMEYLDGEDLDAILNREGPLPWQRVGDMAVQICSGLATAHRHGIIHRDIKPQNCFQVLVDDNPGHIKIIDFGVARDEARAGPTQQGFVIGTPEYSAPELLQGAKANPRTDVYALGVTLYKLLTGIAPFHGATPMETLRKHVTERLVPPSQVASHLEIPPIADDIIGRALDKDPNKRFTSAEEMSRALKAALGLQLSGVMLRPEFADADSHAAQNKTESAGTHIVPGSSARSPTALAAEMFNSPGPISKVPHPEAARTSKASMDPPRTVDRPRLIFRSAGLVMLSLAFLFGTRLVRPKETKANLERELDRQERGSDHDGPADTQPLASTLPARVSPQQADDPKPQPTALPSTVADPQGDDVLAAPPSEPEATPPPLVELEVPDKDPPTGAEVLTPSTPDTAEAPTKPEPRFDYKEAQKLIDEQSPYLRGTCMTKAANSMKRLRLRVDVRPNGRPTVKVISSERAVRKCVRDLLMFSFDPTPRGGAFTYELTETTSSLQKMPIDPSIVK